MKTYRGEHEIDKPNDNPKWTLSVMPFAASCGEQVHEGWVANSRMRSFVRSIELKDIESIEIGGPYLSIPSSREADREIIGTPQIERDPNKIAAIIAAFRASRRRDSVDEEPENVKELPDYFWVKYKPGVDRMSRCFNVLGHDDILGVYGPEVEQVYEAYRKKPNASSTF